MVDIHHLPRPAAGSIIPDVAELLNLTWSFAITVADWWTLIAASLLVGFAVGRTTRK